MSIEFTDGVYTEIVGDFTIKVWEHVWQNGPRAVAAYPTANEYGGDCAQIDSRGIVFEVRDSEKGSGYHGDTPEDRAFPIALIERMIAVFRALGGQ